MFVFLWELSGPDFCEDHAGDKDEVAANKRTSVKKLTLVIQFGTIIARIMNSSCKPKCTSSIKLLW